MDTFKRLKKNFLFLIILTIGLSLFTAFFSQIKNWIIFSSSFSHLMEGTSLYVRYDPEIDLFKYSPTFALLMAPLSVLPFWLGGIVANWKYHLDCIRRENARILGLEESLFCLLFLSIILRAKN